MKLRNLSDDNLLHIFAQLPLRKLISLGMVCHRWTILSRAALHQRDTLTLLISEKEEHCYAQLLIKKSPFNAGQDLFAPDRVTPLKALYQLSNSFLKLTHLSDSLVLKIITTFPNVCFLGISLYSECLFLWNLKLTYFFNLTFSDKVPNDFKLVNLLYFWSKSLVSFSLWSNFPSSKLGYSLRELCNTLHSLPALRHLTLDIGTFLLKSLTLLILFQLSSFRLASADKLEAILPTLMDYYHHSSSKKPKCIIDLPTVKDVEMCLDTDKNDLLTVASLFTRLSSKALIWHFYRLFASNFTSLAIVNVDAYRCDSPNQLFSSLATLHKLTHLTLLLTTKIECTTTTSNLPSIHSVRWLMVKCSIGDTQLTKYPLKHWQSESKKMWHCCPGCDCFKS